MTDHTLIWLQGVAAGAIAMAWLGLAIIVIAAWRRLDAKDAEYYRGWNDAKKEEPPNGAGG